MALTALRGKKFKKAKPRLGPRSADEKFMGTEPMPTGNAEKDAKALSNASTWYNYFYGSKEAVNRLCLPYFKKDKTITKKLKALPEWKIGTQFSALCQLKANGFVFGEDRQNYFDNRLAELLELGEKALAEKIEENIDVPVKPVLSIQERTQQIINGHIAELEGILDEYYDSGYKMEFDCYAWLQKNDVKPNNVKPIIDFYNPVLEEIRELLAGTCDQLIEGYSHLNKSQQKGYLKFLETFMNDLIRYSDVAKTVRKTRVKKAPTLEKQVKGLKYLEKSDEFKLASVSPTDIIGAQALWVFDTSNRELSVYRATTPGPGLVIKGTTIMEWSDGSSTKKKLRKPEETLQAFMSTNKRSLPKFMDTLTTKGSRPKDRINKNMILLKIES